MQAVARTLVPSLLVALVVLWAVYRTDRRRQSVAVVAWTFGLGGLAAAVARLFQSRAAAWSGLDLRASVAGEAGALLFLLAFVAPMREAAKVVACWPAFRSRHVDRPYDGVIYASASALGYSAAENAWMLHAFPSGGIWVARALFALPAHLFFACIWGYALGRSHPGRGPGRRIALSFLCATLGHALYIHLVFGRGPGALIAVAPLLAAMGIVAALAARDLRRRTDQASPLAGAADPRGGYGPGASPAGGGVILEPRAAEFGLPDSLSNPPSLRTVREALRRSNRPLLIRWVFVGTLVTLGLMLTGLALAIAIGLAAHVDFASVDEHDVATTAPVAVLGSGLLGAFPLSGFLIARASGLPSLLEPALATAFALVLILIALGLAAPIAVVFGLAFSPIAFGLACAGALVGRRR